MNVLYIDIDSLRPDHLGCYGYHRDTSPAIDALARDGMMFRRCYTPDAPCLPSRTAFYSGRLGIQTGVVGHAGTAAEPKREGVGRSFRDRFEEQGLARQLQQAGLHTAMISPFGQRHAAWQFYAGFNEIHNTGRYGLESAEEVQPVVDEWLARHAGGGRWFLHVNYWDPHTPYRVPLAYGEPFAGDPLPAWLDDEAVLARHRRRAGPHTALDIAMYDDATDPRHPRQPGKITDRAALRRMIDGYDTGVRYADDHVARIIGALKKAGVYDDTIIIVSGDHGENLGELGIYGEHATADEVTCRVPLIVRCPGGPRGAVDDAFHYNLDLAPTLMELLGGEAQPLWDGQSFAATLRDGTVSGRDSVVVSHCAHVCQRSARWGDWLYMRTYHDGFHLFPPEMLFNLAADPHEQRDLAADGGHAALCHEGAWRLAAWHDAQMQTMARTASDVVDPLWTVIREGGPFHASLGKGQPGVAGFHRYLARLEQTGRADGARQLREKYQPRPPR
ncbi:MAG: sulfatase-like hydrolase/transferase [Verrucomicrobiales bacterium]|jgi:arylsulfatase A-like enzyme|nr:sulfatase-like hydrolase/transferase [Verrucomicrobiales bacterium]